MDRGDDMDDDMDNDDDKNDGLLVAAAAEFIREWTTDDRGTAPLMMARRSWVASE